MKNKNIQKINYQIREESPKDFPEIYKLIKTAFETAKVKDGDEQDFADNLRKNERYIPQLALVAEHESKLIAHIMLTKTYVESENGLYEALLLAPICVLIEYRDMGIGSDLIKESFVRARELGFEAVFLCGDPAYYHRFGFRPTSEFGIKPKQNIPPEYVMGYELKPNALGGITGIADLV